MVWRVTQELLELIDMLNARDDVDGILVPGGFGNRGTGGMLAAAEFSRRTGVPYFGICYGFQWAVTEYAQHVCGLEGANATEVDPDTPHKVIYKLQDLLGVEEMGGTMRLGRYPAELAEGSPHVTFDDDDNTITIEATATIPTEFMSVAGVHDLTVTLDAADVVALIERHTNGQ